MSKNSIQDLRKFVAPEFIFSAGAMRLAGRYAKNFGGSKVLLATYKNCIRYSLTGRVIESLEEAGLQALLRSVGLDRSPGSVGVSEGTSGSCRLKPLSIRAWSRTLAASASMISG
ncbi:hypothetical protein [Methanocella arvoryzae]|uniref:hypothetical protein n=1 Tax=Methanocella arvoryzae TaxID=1175445 RepID=UPI0003212B30|nr:hypothetical protein [Methanocella arvoryzae]